MQRVFMLRSSHDSGRGFFRVAAIEAMRCGKKIHGNSSVLLPPLGRGDRVQLATCRDTVGPLPVSLGR
jgi:hypothetical protein